MYLKSCNHQKGVLYVTIYLSKNAPCPVIDEARKPVLSEKKDGEGERERGGGLIQAQESKKSQKAPAELR